jgi:catechol 2,3-dioxygenase-like lactoylglutathione lyase family enzyme
MDHPATSDRKGPAVRPHHVAFTVADLNRARAWYAAAPGLRAPVRLRAARRRPATMLHAPDGARLELCKLRCGSGGGSRCGGGGRRFGAGLGAVIGLVHGRGGSLPRAGEAEDHAREDGEGGEEPERCDGAGAGQCDGG